MSVLRFRPVCQAILAASCFLAAPMTLCAQPASASNIKASTSTLTAAPAAASAKTISSIVWETNFAAALAKAKAGNKMMMVDFYTDWCHWCKVLDEKTYTDPRVIEAASRMVCAKVDGDRNGDLTIKYGVEGYPAILFLKPDGTELHRISGFAPPEDFLPDMQSVLKGLSPQQELEESIKKGSDDPAILMRVGNAYLKKNENEKALPYLEKAAPKLSGKDAVRTQSILAVLYLDANKTEKANAALEELRKNPAAEPMDVNRLDLRIALTLQDRKRAEKALDKIKEIVGPQEKESVEQLRSNLDQVMKSFANRKK